MKKTVLIIALLLIAVFMYPSEWINVNNKDYKIQSIDTVQKIVVCSGWYDVKEIDGEYFPEYQGEYGAYFFYNVERDGSIVLTEENVQEIIDLIYPKIEEIIEYD